MKSALPYMPWFPRDFLAATLGWSLLERGLYRALLDAQWEQGSLPCDKPALIRIAQATEDEFDTAWPRVKEKFHRRKDGTIVNKKLEKHRQLAIKKHDERVKTGRAGAQKRWASHSSANSSANGRGNSKSIATKTITKDKSKKKNPPYPPKGGVDWQAVDGLDQEAWQVWLAHRRAERYKPLRTDMTAKALAKYPIEIQRAAITQSMDKGWQGLFPERVKLDGESRQSGEAGSRFERHTERLRDWLEDQVSA